MTKPRCSIAATPATVDPTWIAGFKRNTTGGAYHPAHGAQCPMKTGVIAGIDHTQIVRAIVLLVSVDMVHMLARVQRSAENLFHHNTMLIPPCRSVCFSSIAIVNKHLNIATGSDPRRAEWKHSSLVPICAKRFRRTLARFNTARFSTPVPIALGTDRRIVIRIFAHIKRRTKSRRQPATLLKYRVAITRACDAQSNARRGNCEGFPANCTDQFHWHAGSES